MTVEFYPMAAVSDESRILLAENGLLAKLQLLCQGLVATGVGFV